MFSPPREGVYVAGLASWCISLERGNRKARTERDTRRQLLAGPVLIRGTTFGVSPSYGSLILPECGHLVKIAPKSWILAAGTCWAIL
jgi:hypothetical protein